MAKTLPFYSIFLSLCVLFIIVFVHESSANVTIRDVKVSSNLEEGLTSGVIETGSENSNYELVICGIQASGPNPFNTPLPGSWEELNNGQCSEPNCQLGIWGREADSTLSEEITCGWDEGSTAFTAVSLSFAGVDTEDPVIDIACSEFIEGNFVLDSISSSPGAQIISIQLIERLGDSGEEFFEFNSLSGQFRSNVKFSEELILSLAGSSVADKDGAGQEGFMIPPLLEVFNTQFCVLSLRMLNKKPIPTLSEWGLMAMAGVLGVVGLLFVVRRRAAAV